MFGVADARERTRGVSPVRVEYAVLYQSRPAGRGYAVVPLGAPDRRHRTKAVEISSVVKAGESPLACSLARLTPTECQELARRKEVNIERECQKAKIAARQRESGCRAPAVSPLNRAGAQTVACGHHATGDVGGNAHSRPPVELEHESARRKARPSAGARRSLCRRPEASSATVRRRQAPMPIPLRDTCRGRANRAHPAVSGAARHSGAPCHRWARRRRPSTRRGRVSTRPQRAPPARPQGSPATPAGQRAASDTGPGSGPSRNGQREAGYTGHDREDDRRDAAARVRDIGEPRSLWARPLAAPSA